MKQEALKNVVEERNALRDCLRKARIEEGKHYDFESYLETANDVRYVSTQIKVKEDVYLDEHKKIYDTITAFHEPRTGNMVEDNEAPYTFSIATQIDEEAYQALSEYQDSSDDCNLEGAIAGFTSENGIGVGHTDKNNTSQVILSEVSSKSEGHIKTIMDCVTDTVTDRNVQMEAAGCAAAAALATSGILVMKKYRETPTQDGESRLHKVKRVMSSTFKEQSSWFKIAGLSLLAYGLSIGYHVGKRVR